MGSNAGGESGDARETAGNETSGTDRRTIRVLHVDDEPRFTDLAREFLERADDRVEVVTETNAEDGLARLEAEPVDCVVSDYEMPGRDGLEFLDMVRERDEDLPFILFTGRGSETVASDAIAAGVTDYLQKESGTDQYTVLANRVGNAVEQYRSRQALAASQERLSLFIDQSPLGVVEWNQSFDLVRMNDAAEEILGYGEAELSGTSWERIVPESARDSVESAIEKLLAGEGGYHGVNENLRADGEVIVCEWHNRVVTDDDGAVVAVFSQFQEVTDRHEHQAALETLHDSTRDLLTATSREAVAEIAAETAANVLDMPTNGLYLEDGSEDCLRPAAVSHAVGSRIGDPPTFRPGNSIAWDVYESGEPRVFEDVSTQPGRYSEDTAIRSEIILPLGDHGVFLIGATTVDAYDDTDVALAKILASNVEAALSRIDREASLRENRKRYRTLVDNFPDGGVFLYDDDLRFELAAGEELDRVGLDPDDVVGRTLEDLFSEDIFGSQEPHYRAALDGETRTFEQQYLGEWYRVKTAPVGADGETGMVVTQNVTELKERRRQLETLVENLPGMVYRCRNEPGWPMEEVRGEVAALTGYEPERLERGDAFWGEEVLHPEDREEMWETVQAALAEDDSFEVTYRIVRADGETRWMWERGRAVRRGDEEHLEGFIADITDRKETEERLSAFIEAASDVLALVDEDGVVRDVSPSVERVTGYEPAALEGEELAKYVHPEDRDRIAAAFQEMLDDPDTTTRRFRCRFRTADGDWQWLESVGSNRSDTALDGYVVTSRDITEAIEHERALERRNERLDQFASVVSHDLRNPLGVANGYVELLADDYEDERIDEVDDALSRMTRIVDNLLTLARVGDEALDRRLLLLSDVVRSAWDTVDTNGATLSAETDLRVRADESCLRQILENLFRNAVEHGSTDGNPATVEVGPLEPGDGFYVADDGPGIEPERREQVFDSEHSTGDDGLGLGLAIVDRLAAAHEWDVAVTASESDGARFEVRDVRTD